MTEWYEEDDGQERADKGNAVKPVTAVAGVDDYIDITGVLYPAVLRQHRVGPLLAYVYFLRKSCYFRFMGARDTLLSSFARSLRSNSCSRRFTFARL